ncbi:MAG: hypothetical protein K6F28_02585 [Lachnospiraceae bacterium]|nr:hypothetical protein [Lachnospiraceae bacterium]
MTENNVISGDYALRIRERDELLRLSLKTKRALRLTFITVHGVKKNKYSDIVDNEIKAED